MKKLIGILCILTLLLLPLSGCKNNDINPNLDLTKDVKLRIVGPWDNFKAIETLGDMFTSKYPNCTIIYEDLQEYYASLEKRLSIDSDVIDLFVTTNVSKDENIINYTLDLYTDERVDLSQTFPGLIENFEFRSDEGKNLYVTPMGAELRGLYVNVTLLKSLDLAVPTNVTELLACCEKLLANGYIPFQGNPGNFGQLLLYPYFCNLVANAEDGQATYDAVNSREEGISELFREPLELLYELVSKGYFNYKYVENTTGFFKDYSDFSCASFLLNLKSSDGEYSKIDDLGQVAFMPGPFSMNRTISKAKEDYHSEIEYEFMLAPVSDEGGFAYLSPSHGIAINKGSHNLDWAIEFFNFMFKEKNNEIFAAEFNMTPNTANAFEIISNMFEVPENHVSHLGEVTFDYGFYSAVTTTLVEVSKGNNPKYMLDVDGKQEMYPFEHYMNNLESRLTGKE